MDEKLRGLTEAYNAACDELDSAIAEFEGLSDDADEDTIKVSREKYAAAEAKAEASKAAKEEYASVQRSKERFKKDDLPESEELARKGLGGITVDEPDMYTKKNKRFVRDLFSAQVKGDFAAAQRLAKHQEYEIERWATKLGVDKEQFAVSTGTLGGVIPPQYLVNLYAKAPRNGRVFVDQCNHDDDLPEEGMSIIVPRLTAGGTAAAQASEGTTVAEQDPTEVDLTIPVRTIAGYFPVSRQTLERASYSEPILFEDLIARYHAALDSGAISGAGTSGTLLGLLNTSGISTSTASTATVAGVWPKLADVIQQINTAVGGLGYYADKIFMHPRRWGFFEAALDSQNRPLFGISGENYAVTNVAEGDAAGYGFVGKMHGLPVFIDANIPTNIGAGTNQDAIIVVASRIVHLWEQEDAPVTLAFEQQAGNALQTQLVAYGYAAFTAGRYPAGASAINGVGLVPPTF
jgi:HK97 family phage major capsid protein